MDINEQLLQEPLMDINEQLLQESRDKNHHDSLDNRHTSYCSGKLLGYL
jgi:hypothetical protein